MRMYDVIRNARRFVPEASYERCMAELEQVHAEIVAAIPGAERAGSAHSVSFAANDGEKPLPGFSQIESVHWGGKPLTETSVELLTKMEPGWRSAQAGVPQKWYVVGRSGSLQLGLHPRPASSGQALVFGARRDQSLRSFDTSPLLPSAAPYVYGLAARLAALSRPDMFQSLWQLYAVSLAQAQAAAATASEPLRMAPFQNPRSNAQNQPDSSAV